MDWVKFFEIVGPVGAICILVIYALSKWLIPSLKRNGIELTNQCPFLGTTFDKHCDQTESNLGKLVTLAEKQEVYLREISESNRRLETAMTHLSAKLLNGASRKD